MDALEADVDDGDEHGGIHAPIMNFDTTTTMVTMPVATDPTALITVFRRQPASFSRRWWRAMQAWESVNAVNTPTA